MVSLLALFLTAPGAAIAAIPWHMQTIPKATAKPVLVYFRSGQLGLCRMMEREIFQSPSVAEEIEEHFVPVWIDLGTRTIQVEGGTSIPTQSIMPSAVPLVFVYQVDGCCVGGFFGKPGTRADDVLQALRTLRDGPCGGCSGKPGHLLELARGTSDDAAEPAPERIDLGSGPIDIGSRSYGDFVDLLLEERGMGERSRYLEKDLTETNAAFARRARAFQARADSTLRDLGARKVVLKRRTTFKADYWAEKQQVFLTAESGPSSASSRAAVEPACGQASRRGSGIQLAVCVPPKDAAAWLDRVRDPAVGLWLEYELSSGIRESSTARDTKRQELERLAERTDSRPRHYKAMVDPMYEFLGGTLVFGDGTEVKFTPAQ